MSINMTTTIAELTVQISKQVQRAQTVLIRQLLYCAEEVVNEARSTNSYKDQTGNLRSSLGCVVAVDGKVVGEYGFNAVLNGQEGATEGKEYAREVVARFPKGIVLIAVAGKNYASYVSAKGLDVLDSAELLAERLVPMYLKQLGFLK